VVLPLLKVRLSSLVSCYVFFLLRSTDVPCSGLAFLSCYLSVFLAEEFMRARCNLMAIRDRLTTFFILSISLLLKTDNKNLTFKIIT